MKLVKQDVFSCKMHWNKSSPAMYNIVHLDILQLLYGLVLSKPPKINNRNLMDVVLTFSCHRKIILKPNTTYRKISGILVLTFHSFIQSYRLIWERFWLSPKLEEWFSFWADAVNRFSCMGAICWGERVKATQRFQPFQPPLLN